MPPAASPQIGPIVHHRAVAGTTRHAAFRRGVLAGACAVLALLAGSAVTARPGALEVVADGATRIVPLPVFESILLAIGPLAKGALFSAVVAATILAGGVLAVPLRRVVGTVRAAAAILAVVATSAALEGSVTWAASGAPYALGTAYEFSAVVVPSAIACVVYALVLVAGLQAVPTSVPGAAATGGAGVSPVGPTAVPGASPTEAGISRRVLLARGAVIAGGLALVGDAAVTAARVVTAAVPGTGTRPVGSDPGGFGPTPALTPVPDFYIVLKDVSPPVVDGAAWRLVIDGLVDRPHALGLAELRALPSRTGYRTLECISYTITIPNDLISNQLWRGVPVADLLDAAAVRPGAAWVWWTAADGYTESLPLAVARDPETWIAYEMGGAPLTVDHGFPARVLVAGRFGMKQPKWVTRLSVADRDRPGFWEQNGWDEQAVVRVMSRIDTPHWRDTVQAGVPFAVTGIAFAGDRGIARVEVSPDDGATWRDAILEDASRAPLGPLTWVRWRSTLVVTAPGPAMLAVRATDGHGTVQSGVYADAPPAGSAGWDRVGVTAVA